MTRVLIVEDEPAIAELVAINLRHEGFEVRIAGDAAAAVTQVDERLPDLVILDWMLPGQSGLQLSRSWRAQARTKALPIIMLTALGSETDRIVGLEIGADDYVAKPFNPRELLARIKVILRRTRSLPPNLQPQDEARMCFAGRAVGRLDQLIAHPLRIPPRQVVIDHAGGRAKLQGAGRLGRA